MEWIPPDKRSEFLIELDKLKFTLGIDCQNLKLFKENKNKLRPFKELKKLTDKLSKSQNWNLHLSILYCYLFGLPPLKRMFKITERGSVTYDVTKVFLIKEIKTVSEIKNFTSLDVIASARFGLYRELISILTLEEFSTILLGNDPFFNEKREDKIEEHLLEWVDKIINSFKSKIDKFLYSNFIFLSIICSKSISKLSDLLTSIVKSKNYLLIINSSSLLFGSFNENKNQSERILTL